MTVEDLQRGASIAGRYELIERLPDAPAGSRWRVIDSRGPEGRLTWLPGAALRDDVARGLPRFGHMNVVPVRDVGAHRGGVYVVSAMPIGVPLRAFLADHRGGAVAFPLRDVRTLLDQVAQSLVAAHRGSDGAPVVHGGVLAESVWVETRGGSQRIVTVDDFSLPLLCGKTRTVADDIAALGLLLAEVLLGEVATPTMDLDAVSRRVRPDVDRSVWELVRACVDGEGRPASAQSFRDRLRSADWTPREVEVPRERSATPAPSFVSFERARPSAPEASVPTPRSIEPPRPPMPSPSPPPRSAAVLPPAVEPARTAAVLPPTVEPAPSAATDAEGVSDTAKTPVVAVPTPTKSRIVARAQLGRGFGVLFAKRHRSETAEVFSLPTGAAAKELVQTLKPRGLIARRREKATLWVDDLEANTAPGARGNPSPGTRPTRAHTYLPVGGPDARREAPSIGPMDIDATMRAPRGSAVPTAFPGEVPGAARAPSPAGFLVPTRPDAPAMPSRVPTTPARKGSRAVWLWAALASVVVLVIVGAFALC